MSTAECADRTGLTVRALRVYERHGLIEPKRTGKGWRCYGPRELQRLNVIVTLKALGMTLAQVRTLLATNPPPLARVLQLQLQACSARRDAADQAVGLVKAALATIESGRRLSLDDLCNLTRSMEMEDPYALFQMVREALNETLTPEEERAMMTWVAARPQDEAKALRECAPAMRALHGSLQDLWEKRVDPAAPEVQALIVEEKDLAVRYGLQNRMAMLFEWNMPLAQKWTQFGERLRTRRMFHQSESAAPSKGWAAYLQAARTASPWYRALEPVVEEAAVLADKNTQPSAAPAQALIGRLRRICADHSLGDPLVYARCARAMQFRRPATDRARKQAAWTFLANAVRLAPSADRIP